MTNQHSAPEARADTTAANALANGATLISRRPERQGFSVVLADTNGMAGDPWATWVMRDDTGLTFEGHYFAQFDDAERDFRTRGRPAVGLRPDIGHGPIGLGDRVTHGTAGRVGLVVQLFNHDYTRERMAYVKWGGRGSHATPSRVADLRLLVENRGTLEASHTPDGSPRLPAARRVEAWHPTHRMSTHGGTRELRCLDCGLGLDREAAFAPCEPLDAKWNAAERRDRQAEYDDQWPDLDDVQAREF